VRDKGVDPAYYRSGEWDELIRRLQESIQASPGSDWVSWPSLAPAHYRRGDVKEGNLWLGKAEECLQEQTAAGSKLRLFRGGHSFDLQVLTKEARSTFRGGKP
jgi:hypothetical protein